MDQAIGIEQRMQQFLESQAHVTPLDGHVAQPPGVKIADYLFFDRGAVVEMKTLDVDPKEKILEGAKPIMDSPEFPLIFGSYDLGLQSRPHLVVTPNSLKFFRMRLE
ncbi:hypothetical protein [Pseudomonas sp. Irchel 3E13]|jgi:hypothetical protein|uniref:hypothetical protein n=1 Tax=Pseudomonas sp. Irchel 3E13 TaxID=2008975 RepID=UPI000BA4D9DC|nr:hypothetical protein [Pseudomonas sp. Irchel 3E13]